MKLAYQAYDRAGQVIEDVIDAVDAAEATDQLRRKGLFVAQIHQAAEKGHAGKIEGRAPGKTTRLKYLTAFCRQMQVLISSGTPLVQALEALERQVKPGHWKQTLQDVRLHTEEGMPMSEAMGRHPVYFNAITRSMIAAGESSGAMADMLARLSELVHKQLQVRKAVLGAMAYPCVLTTLAGGVLIVLLLFVIPRFAELFETLDVPLPPTTQVMVTLSGALRAYWWMALCGLAAAAVGLKFYLASPAGKRAIDLVLVRTPKIGMVTRNVVTARIIRLLGSMLTSRVPVLESLKLTREGAGNSLYIDLIDRAENAVTKGEPISLAFDNPALISPSVYEAIRSGEGSGKVGPLLLTLSDFLDEENEVLLRSLTSIIEPLILIVMGLVVGVVATSLFIPLFDLTGNVGGGA